MAAFLANLARDDLAPATLRGCRCDLRHFVAWRRTVPDGSFVLEGLPNTSLGRQLGGKREEGLHVGGVVELAQAGSVLLAHAGHPGIQGIAGHAGASPAVLQEVGGKVGFGDA